MDGPVEQCPTVQPPSQPPLPRKWNLTLHQQNLSTQDSSRHVPGKLSRRVSHDTEAKRRARARLSKSMAYCLRHRGPNSLRPDGFALVGDIARMLSLDVHAVMSLAVPLPGEKQRFEILDNNGKTWVRARHGHSDTRVQAEQMCTLIETPLPCLVHATQAHCVPLIIEEGLKSFGRQDIYFVDSDSEEALSNGFRSNCDRLVYVNMQLAMASGLDFYRTPDGMIMGSGLEGTISNFLVRTVRHRRSRHVLWVQEGHEYHI